MTDLRPAPPSFLQPAEPDPGGHGPSLGRGIGYLPGIDGLRALAVFAVIAYHLDASWAVGGYLGVEVFFVLSGFLITTLLLAEHRSTGEIDRVAFWIRRARRLLPAVIVLVVLVCAYAAVLAGGELHRFRGDAVASLLYVQNWHAIFTEQPYFDAFGRPSPLRHLWSLAIEEQFYLLWPLVLPVALRRLDRRRTVHALGAAIAVSALLMALTADITAPERAYYGTDTRLFGILLGAVLAFGWRPQRARRDVGVGARRVLDAAGAAALVLLAWQHARRSEFDPFTYPWGFLVVDGLTLVAIVAVTHPACRLERIVGCGPLQAIGRRSYSIYLWHWPVIVFTRPGVDWGLTGPSALVARLVLIAALAEASYRFIEQPVRDGRVQRWLTDRTPGAAAPFRLRRAALGAGVTTAVFVAVLVAAPAPSRIDVATGVAADGPRAITIDPDDAPPDPGRPPAEEPDVPAARADPDDGERPSATDGSPEPAPDTPPTAPPAPADGDPLPGYPPAAYNAVTVIGESVTLGAAGALRQRWDQHVQIDAVEGRQFADGVAVLESLAADGRLTPVVILHLGNNGIAPPEWWDRAVAAVGPERRLVVVSVRVPKRWEGQVNGEVLRIAAEHDNVVLADWNTVSASEPGLLSSDGVHPTPRGIEVYRDLLAWAAGG